MTRAKDPFLKSMERVHGLLALHPSLHGGRGRPRQHVSDVLRGAIVLAVGALDGLVLEAVVETIKPAGRRRDLGPDVAKWVKDDPQRLIDALGSPDPLEDIAAYAREHLGTMTFQRAAAIQGVLSGVGRCEPPWQKAAERLTTGSDVWDEGRVRDRLDEFVRRRNAIAHSGDRAATSTASTPIQLSYVEEAARVIEAVGLAISEVVDDRLRNLR
jgi:hypothetical protein